MEHSKGAPEQHYDLVIIGGGTGGYVGAIRAAQLGKKVALIEQNKLGGTCLHQGCIPTKALLESSQQFFQLNHAAEHGIEVNLEGARLNLEKVYLRKQEIVKQLFQGIKHLMKKNKIHVLEGTGELAGKTDKFQIIIRKDGDKQSIYAEHVILAAGSRPKVPEGIQLDGVHLFTSNEILENPIRPNHITVVGAGAIGVEFACYFKEIGSEVRIIEWSDRLVPLEDKDISLELNRLLTRKGIETVLHSKVETDRIHKMSNNRLEYIVTSQQGGSATFETDAILFAIGRQNNTEHLGLSTVGLLDGEKFVKVNERMQTAISGLYAIGDIAGSYQLAHVAVQQALIAVDTICGKYTVPYDPMRVPRCTYSHPEIASVGLTEAQAMEAGYLIRIGKFPLKMNGRSIIHGEIDGFMKLVIDKESDLLLGAHFIGNHATELISVPSLAIFLEGTAWEMAMNVYPHPTISEIIGEAAHDALQQAIHM